MRSIRSMPLSTAFDTDRETFLGLYNGFDEPEAVLDGRSRNSVAHGWSPIASHSLEISLKPGESRDLIFTLGYIENPQEQKWESKGCHQQGSGPRTHGAV